MKQVTPLIALALLLAACNPTSQLTAPQPGSSAPRPGAPSPSRPATEPGQTAGPVDQASSGPGSGVPGLSPAASPQPPGTPAAPAELKVLAQTRTSLGLEWASADQVTQWKVYLDGHELAVLPAGTTHYQFEHLSPNRIYRLGLQALNALGESGIVSLSVSTSRSSSGGGGGSASAPFISSLSQLSGLVGDAVTINGSNFGQVSSVSLSGVEIPYAISSEATIQIEVPGGVATGVISVSNDDGSATSASFELRNRVWLVDDSAMTGSDDGSSWANAHKDLQDALAQAASGDEIWVAAGTYLPSDLGLREASFQLQSGVALDGGFAGNENLRSRRDPAVNISRLSGDLGGNDDFTDSSLADMSENSRQLVLGAADSLLDGFTLAGGYEDTNAGGAALYLTTGAPDPTTPTGPDDDWLSSDDGLALQAGPRSGCFQHHNQRHTRQSSRRSTRCRRLRKAEG